MTTAQRLALIDQILDYAPPDDVREWAMAWLEMHPDAELRDVARHFLTPIPFTSEENAR